MQKGKQSLCFTEAPFIISTANIVGKKEGRIAIYDSMNASLRQRREIVRSLYHKSTSEM